MDDPDPEDLGPSELRFALSEEALAEAEGDGPEEAEEYDEEGAEIGRVPAEDGECEEDVPENDFNWAADFVDQFAESGPEDDSSGKMGKSMNVDKFEWDD